MTSSLPRWANPVYDAGQMRAIDRWAIDQAEGRSLELMELAGMAVASAALEPAPEGPIVILAGKGNNGGDGLVAARLLRENHERLKERQVEVILIGDRAELADDARANLDRLPGEAPRAYDAELVMRAGVIVDAMLGTGSSGSPRGAIADAITAVNLRATAARVIAVDIPTGVDATTGRVAGDAVQAELTIALHAPKIGHYVAPGVFHCGEVRVAEIGIPPEAAAGAGVVPAAGTIGPGVLRAVPPRTDISSKFSSGSLVLLGGSTGLTGAICLAAMAAQRTGAGYVTAMVPSGLNPIFETRLLEAMTVALPDDDGAMTAAGASVVLERAARADAVVVGPGIGRAAGTLDLVREVVAGADAPLVLDADGLLAFSGRLEDLRREHVTVITPHSGELARLLGVGSDDVAEARLDHAVRAADASGAIVVLKGTDTIIAAPGECPVVNTRRAPALATAGTGDVLAGIIGALLAMGIGSVSAAAAGVYAHALAGREASEHRGAGHVIAGDVIEALPAVLG